MKTSEPVRILVVEDEEVVNALICSALTRRGYTCVSVTSAAEAGAEMARARPDLILLDWMLPGRSGFEFARQLKRDDATREIPIILLTARAGEHDKVRGLDAGADDYVTKPFSTAELASRVNAVLRRAMPRHGDEVLRLAGLVIDVEAHRVEAGGAPVTLRPTEYRLLVFLATHAERVHSRSKLLDAVWSPDAYVDERTVDVHIRRLREALAPSGLDRLIQTVRGVGYRLSTGD